MLPANRFRMRCPHCRAQALVRDSEEVTPLTRELYFACSNTIACGHSFKALLSIECTISPSAIPNPAVNLPVSPYAVRRATGADNQPDMFREEESEP